MIDAKSKMGLGLGYLLYGLGLTTVFAWFGFDFFFLVGMVCAFLGSTLMLIWANGR